MGQVYLAANKFQSQKVYADIRQQKHNARIKIVDSLTEAVRLLKKDKNSFIIVDESCYC